MGNKYIPYQIIISAKHGDPEAMKAILHHYERYINHFSKRVEYDDCGNSYDIVDSEIKQRIEEKLMLGIIYKFDCDRLPEGETLEL